MEQPLTAVFEEGKVSHSAGERTLIIFLAIAVTVDIFEVTDRN